VGNTTDIEELKGTLTDGNTFEEKNHENNSVESRRLFSEPTSNSVVLNEP
jgi:hypothetical protein